MTDATGRSFLSYRRTQVATARLVIEAQHDVGIPTWQDLSDLNEGHAEALLREALADPLTANAVCWLTPDVEQSAVITRTELPCVIQRIKKNDGFFMVPVLAGGLDYAGVTRIAGTYLGAHDLGEWNLRKITEESITSNEVARVARWVLERRIRMIGRQLATGAPLRLILNTRKKPGFSPGVALVLDWTHRFDGRKAADDAWAQYLLPALEAVAQACAEQAAGRFIVAEGLCGLPAAVALGCTFLAPRGAAIAWRQISPNREPQLWSLSAEPAPSGFAYKIGGGDPNGDDMALLVSVASDVEPAFGASRASLPKLRCLVLVNRPGAYPHDIETAEQARDLVRIIVEGLRHARERYQPRGTLHLFLAVPAGLAMMIGQMLNTFGGVLTYEHVPTDAVGRYVPAAQLQPSM